MPLVALVRLGRVSGNGLVKRVCKPNVSVWSHHPSYPREIRGCARWHGGVYVQW